MESFGERVVKEIDDLGRKAEENPPSLRQRDAWDKRVDTLNTSEAWRKLHDISAEEGMVALGYERSHTQWRYVISTSGLVIILLVLVGCF